jgi:DNA-binding Lrp family transcriptional regulator
LPTEGEDFPSERNNLHKDLVRMTNHLTEFGPNVNEMARHVGQFKETVRYRYHKYVIEKEFAIQANLNYSRLGFTRLVLLVKLAPQFAPYASAIFIAMSDLCYLKGFQRLVFDGSYILQVAVPASLAGECEELYLTLQQMGLFAELEVNRFEEMRNAPMKPEYYDFTTGSWSYDWPKLDVVGPNLVPSVKSEVEPYDRIDLLILKELDADARRSMATVAKNVAVGYKTIHRHYAEHVLGRGLIRGYRILWPGSRYDFKREKAMTKKHRYIESAIILKGATEAERAELMSLLNNTPFLWSEASNPGYYAEVYVPPSYYSEFIDYLGAFSRRARAQLSVLMVDQSNALSFTIAYKLFDRETGKWQLNSGDTLARFKSLIMNVRSGGAK